MKRVRSDVDAGSSVVVRDVPCSLAGNMRRFDYTTLRAELFDLHTERTTLTADLAEMKRRHRTFRPRADIALWRALGQDIVAYERICSPDDTYARDLEIAWTVKQTSLDGLTAMVKSVYKAWRKIHREREAAFHWRLSQAKSRLAARQVHWTNTVPGFRAHLRGRVDPDCECFLCAGEFYVPSHKGVADQCYFCLARITPTSSAHSLAAQVRAFSCDVCYAIAQRNGVCAFCHGHVDAPDTTNTPCAGRLDLLQSGMRAYMGSPVSSSSDDLFR